MTIRGYVDKDYEQVVALYQQSALYGGQLDNHRDNEARLRARVEADPDAIIVAEEDGKIVGTVSLIEDGRVAWLFRFAVKQHEDEADIAQQLCDQSLKALKSKGHGQVLVYTPVEDERLQQRYADLGFTHGGDYTCYWKNIA
jgi:predicted N-acetyltransferase YhbS